MKDNVLDIILMLAAIILIFVLCSKINTLQKERDKYYKTTCILSDCVHNMIDNYGDEDDIYSNYINIAYEEANVTEEEFVNYSYCY